MNTINGIDLNYHAIVLGASWCIVIPEKSLWYDIVLSHIGMVRL